MRRISSRTEIASLFVYQVYGHGGRFYGCRGTEARSVAEGSERTAYGRTGARDLPPGGIGGGLLAADFVGTVGGNTAQCSDTIHSFGHGSPVSKTGENARQEAAWTPPRPSRQSPPSSRSHRSTRGPSSAPLSALLGSLETLRGHAHALYGRYPRRHKAGGHRTHNPSRLVPAVPEDGRTGGSQRTAARRLGQPHVGHDVLAALRPGQHTLADRRRVQLPLPDEGHAGRSGANVAADAGRPLPLVRAIAGRSLGFRRLARR